MAKTLCSRCHAAGIDHATFKAECEQSLFKFVKYFVSDWVTQDLHLPVTEWLQEETEAGSQYFLLMLPRGHLKTTVFTVGYSLWRAIQNPDIRIAIVMSSKPLAVEKVGSISEVAQSDDFKHFWGHLVPEPTQHGTTWTKDALEFRRSHKYPEPTISAFGAATKVTGRHYDIQILDDLVDGSSSNSDLQMAAAIDYLERTDGLWVKRKNAFLLVVGTAWPGGFYEDLLADPLFKKAVFGCYADERYRAFMEERGYDSSAVEDGDPVFVGHETHETLEMSRKRFKAKFVNQMENKFESSGLTMFRRESCQFFNWGDENQRAVVVDNVHYPVSALYKQLTIDPGGSGKFSVDESACVVTGWVRGSGIAFVLDVWHDKVTTKPLVEKILELADRWDVNVVRPEKAAMQGMLIDWLEDEMTRRVKRFWVYPAMAGKTDKGARLGRLQPFVANRQVFFRRDQPEIVEELCNVVVVGGKYKGKVSPNMADALAYSTELWRSSPPVQERPDIEFEDEEGDALLLRRAVRYGLLCESRARRLAL